MRLKSGSHSEAHMQVIRNADLYQAAQQRASALGGGSKTGQGYVSPVCIASHAASWGRLHSDACMDMEHNFAATRLRAVQGHACCLMVGYRC